MKTAAKFIVTAAASLVLGACSTLATRSHVGSVAAPVSTGLRLCFRPDALPQPGQEVQILRRQLVGSGKQPATYLMRKVGTARITGAAADHCVAAVLVEGQARPRDQARWSLPGPQH